MSRVKTNFKQSVALFNKLASPVYQNKVGQMIEVHAKRMIASGQSPVRKEGRYTRYKNEKNYPGDLKPRRPVNLNLTGAMLYHLGYFIKNRTLFFGFGPGTPPDVLTRAQVHQNGTDNIVARPMVPTGGRQFAVSIQKIIRDVYSAALRDILRRI